MTNTTTESERASLAGKRSDRVSKSLEEKQAFMESFDVLSLISKGLKNTHHKHLEKIMEDKTNA